MKPIDVNVFLLFLDYTEFPPKSQRDACAVDPFYFSKTFSDKTNLRGAYTAIFQHLHFDYYCL